MSKRMQQDITQSRIPRLRRFQVASLAPLHVGFPERAIVLALGNTIDPGADCSLVEFDEDTLTPHFGGWYPHWRLARKGRAADFRKFDDIGKLAWRLNTREADQGPYLTQSLNQDDLLYDSFIACRRCNCGHFEIRGRRSRAGIAQHVPFWCLQIRWPLLFTVILTSVFPRFYFLPDLCISIGRKVLQLSDHAQQFDILLAGDLPQYMPVLLHQLSKPVKGIGDSQSGEYQREPAIGGPEQDSPRLFLAWFLVIAAQVRKAAITHREIFHAFRTKGIRHASLLAAALAEHLDIRRLACDTKFAQLEPRPAGDFTVHEAHPGEVIQVPIFTCHEKAGRYHRGWRSSRGTVHMDIARPVGPVGIGLELKQAGIERSQRTTTRAEHPARKGCHRHAHSGIVVKWIGWACYWLGRLWRSKESRDLVPQDGAYGLQEALLSHLHRIGVLPVVQPHHHSREKGQIDNRTNAIGEQHLARAQFADAIFFSGCTHTCCLSPSPGPSVLPSIARMSSTLSPRLRSSKIRLMEGSTSRSEFRQVKGVQSPCPGWRNRPMVCPSLRVR